MHHSFEGSDLLFKVSVSWGTEVLEEELVFQNSNCTAPHAELVVAALPLAIQFWKTKDVQVYENAENGRSENEQ